MSGMLWEPPQQRGEIVTAFGPGADSPVLRTASEKAEIGATSGGVG